jgi:hypothetical protein
LLPPTKVVSGGEGSQSSHVGSVEPESVVGIVMAVGSGGGLDAAAQADSATSPVKADPNSPRWINRYTNPMILFCNLSVHSWNR